MLSPITCRTAFRRQLGAVLRKRASQVLRVCLGHHGALSGQQLPRARKVVVAHCCHTLRVELQRGLEAGDGQLNLAKVHLRAT
jgi:hypothetical protein